VYTGNLLDAGTDAKVHLMLIGKRGDTGFRQLLKPLSSDMSRPFQSGQVNTTMREEPFCFCVVLSVVSTDSLGGVTWCYIFRRF